MFDLGRSFLASVARNPRALAVVDGERRLTYRDWADCLCRLVGGLDRLGLQRGDHLLLALQNNWQMASLHWACQLAGIVATPVNWRISAEALDYFCADAGARAVIFQNRSAAAVAGAPAAQALQRIALESDFDALLQAAPAADLPRAAPDDMSVMLYTSGTTGRGKGVPRRHRAERAAALAHVAPNLYRFGEVTLGVMPLYHTMGVRSLLAMTAVNGAFICLPRFDAGRALELIAAERIGALYLVPTLYRDVLAHPRFADTDVSSVSKLGFAGAPMTAGLLRRLVDAFQPELFVNHYGSSEIYTFSVEQDAASKPGSAGKAGLNQELRVVRIGGDDPEARCAPGEEGEIIAILDGDEAFQGYHRRPDADARALKRGWHFTGDIGHFDSDGDLFVTGRVDDMIITRGENVLPVEIESILSLHPAVAEVAVAGLPDQRLGQKVAAFVSRRAEVTAQELDAYCRQSMLARLKCPRTYVFVKAVPKSPVGKILRRRLLAGECETA